MITRRQVMKTLVLGSTVLVPDFMKGLDLAQAASQSSETHPASSTAKKKKLKATFVKVCTIFNANQDKTIGGYLDQNVQVFSVRHHVLYDGVEQVEGYFDNEFKTHPQFTPATNYKVTVSGLSGWIKGHAGWKDDHGGPENLNFTFKFVYTGAKWLILSLYAADASG